MRLLAQQAEVWDGSRAAAEEREEGQMRRRMEGVLSLKQYQYQYRHQRESEVWILRCWGKWMATASPSRELRC